MGNKQSDTSEEKPTEGNREVARLLAPTQKSYERCNKACCATALWVSDESDKEVLVPLKDVSIHARIDSGIIKQDIQLTYANSNSESPYEVSFEFPLLQQQVVGGLTAKIGEKNVIALIKEKESAVAKYDDAVASGKGAILATKQTDEKKKTQTLNLTLGNLLPGEEAVINLQIIEEAIMVGGSYSFSISGCFFPQYRKHTLIGGEGEIDQYTFSCKVDISAEKKLTYLSVPEGSEKTQEGSLWQVTANDVPTRDFRVFFKTENMLAPNMYVEENPLYPDEVACAAVFAATFEEAEPQDIQFEEDEEPDALHINGADYHFIFVIDQSGSMSGMSMEVAKEALKLFMQSLPVDSKFSIVSFGSRYEVYNCMGQTSSDQNFPGVFSTSDQALKDTQAKIAGLSANFGGTDILRPLEAAYKTAISS